LSRFSKAGEDGKGKEAEKCLAIFADKKMITKDEVEVATAVLSAVGILAFTALS
jgi:hypothetical protein